MQHPNDLDRQIGNLRTLQGSYDQIAGAAEAYNTGKVQLAQNITAKGIAAEPTETLPELAAKVTEIQQTTTVIDGGGMYAAQLTGDGALWNLYDILAQMKSQWMGAGQYACLIVCEYYKGYDSLQLQGADAYYTCDGAFYDYDALHVWTDAENGKANRWVCFLYQHDGARLNITNTAISPRSMYIGGHIGTIEYFVNGRLTELVSGVQETDVVDYFLNKGFEQSWQFNCIIRGVKNICQSSISGKQFVFDGVGTLIIEGLAEQQNISQSNTNVENRNFIRAIHAEFIIIRGIKTLTYDKESALYFKEAKEISLPDIEEIYTPGYLFLIYSSNLQKIYMPNLKKGPSDIFYNYSGVATPDFIDVTVGELTTNLKIIKWNPTNVLTDADKKSQLIDNIKNHILARVSDATGGTQLVFTISTNMYNAIASENITWNDQIMTLADAFLTKNWLLAGA